MPVLLLWGDEDPNGGESVARAFASRLPNATLEVIRQAGHAPWIDELDLCADRTRAFLSSV
jgi:pimeloyl-ACP methyl ester carboxylesterase